jgi:hypothetical protein
MKTELNGVIWQKCEKCFSLFDTGANDDCPVCAATANMEKVISNFRAGHLVHIGALKNAYNIALNKKEPK